MTSFRHEIVERAKDRATSVAGPNDFVLGPAVYFDESDLVSDPRYSLYCFDFAREFALFVELPPGCDLSDAAFVYTEQYSQALSVVALPFADFLTLARQIPLPKNLVVLYSTGRCGSTLASRILARIPDVWSISEPDCLTNFALQRGEMSDEIMVDILSAAMRFICLPASIAKIETVVVKPRSEQVFLMAKTAKALPEIRNLFMYRAAAGYVNSISRMVQRVFGGPAFWNNPDMADTVWYFATANGRSKLAQEIVQTRERPLDYLEMFVVAWMLRMQAYRQVLDQGVDVVALEYEELNANRRLETERLLAACGLDPAWADRAMGVFEKDAHAGSATDNSGAALDLTESQRARVDALVREWSELKQVQD
jgi:hypothetical protein